MGSSDDILGYPQSYHIPRQCSTHMITMKQTAHDTVNPPHSNNAWLQLQIQTPAMSGNRWIPSHHSHPKGMSGQNVVHLECRLEH